MKSKPGRPQNTRKAGAASDVEKERAAKFRAIGEGSSQIIREAALLLDDEIAAGIVAAKKMQVRFRRERRIDPADFKDALSKFQGDAHEVVNALGDQVMALGADKNTALIKRLLENSHGVLDLVVEMLNVGAEITDQIVSKRLPPPKGSVTKGRAGSRATKRKG